MKSHLFDSHNSALVYIKFSINHAWNLSGNNDGRGSDYSLALWSYINTLMKTADNVQTMLSNIFYWMKISEFRTHSRFKWNYTYLQKYTFLSLITYQFIIFA